MTVKTYTLMGRDGRSYTSDTPGTIGGNSNDRIYGRLDCPSALSWLRRGHYKSVRVFFADEETAVAAGYRPCGTCLREKYRAWKESQAVR